MFPTCFPCAMPAFAQTRLCFLSGVKQLKSFSCRRRQSTLPTVDLACSEIILQLRTKKKQLLHIWRYGTSGDVAPLEMRHLWRCVMHLWRSGASRDVAHLNMWHLCMEMWHHWKVCRSELPNVNSFDRKSFHLRRS